MRRIRLAPAATRDVASIRQFLLKRDPAGARRVIDAIRSRWKLLKQHPSAGEPISDGDVRKISVDRYPYVVIYRIGSTDVEILRIHHSAQDWRPH